MGKIDKLVNLMEQRDAAYKRATDDILSILEENVLTGIVTLLSEREPLDQTLLDWKEVELVQLQDGTKTLLISLVISYNLGTIVMTDQGPVELTEELMGYFDKLVRIGVPLEIAQTKNSQEIADFLREEDAKYANDDQDIMQMLADYINPDEQGLLDDINDDQHVREALGEFDLDKLTDEQKRSYLLNMKGGKSRN